MSKKIKILTISDNPLAPSGVATQTKNMIEAVLKTGKYQVLSLAGAMKHTSYDHIRTEEYGEDWVIIPIDGYGDENRIRAMLRMERPDILWFMTDPRFYEWLWAMENEIRPNVPMIYYHVWDNYPFPHFNGKYYRSNDVVVSISKLTEDVVNKVAPSVHHVRIPHSVDHRIFKKKEVSENLKNEFKGKTVFFWNNRNARRKQPGTLIWCFKKFLDIVGKENAALIMHTEPDDPNGPDLIANIKELGLTFGQIRISVEKMEASKLADFYNIADCTINIADAEGFGLSTFESLFCETPIIATMTGGLQEQITDGENWFGIGIQPAAKAVIGSQTVPWIYEDRVSEEDVINAMVKFHEMSKKERDALGRAGRQYLIKNYHFDDYGKQWDELLTYVYENMGSWKNRKNYKNWQLAEVIA